MKVRLHKKWQAVFLCVKKRPLKSVIRRFKLNLLAFLHKTDKMFSKSKINKNGEMVLGKRSNHINCLTQNTEYCIIKPESIIFGLKTVETAKMYILKDIIGKDSK